MAFYSLEEKERSLSSIIGNVSRETLADLDFFEEEILKWQKQINLVSHADKGHIWPRHIIDSAQIFALKPHCRKWLDIGSGGGFPGIVTAIFLKHKAMQENISPALDASPAYIDLIESNQKKAAFLHRIVTHLHLPASVHVMRIEASYETIKQPEIISARALTDLNGLLELCAPWCYAGSIGLFAKGKNWQKEVRESEKNWLFSLKKHKSILEQDSIILEVSALQHKKSDHGRE